MPIIKCDSFVDVYRLKAHAESVHEMSGRTGRPDLTLFVNQQIVEKMRFARTDRVVDVGCGDGTLLKLIATHVASATGVLPSEDEVTRLRSALADLDSTLTIDEGSAQALPVADDMADKLICNGVLLLLDESDIDVALNEISRVARHEALVYIGEIPSVDEFADRDYGDSVSAWLAWVFKTHGMGAFLRSIVQVAKARFSDTPFIIAPKRHAYASPESFIARARKNGLACLEHFPHLGIDSAGVVEPSTTRWDYLFEVRKDEVSVGGATPPAT